jgi:hypothetical protein
LCYGKQTCHIISPDPRWNRIPWPLFQLQPIEEPVKPGHLKVNRCRVSITPIEADPQTGTQAFPHIQVRVTDDRTTGWVKLIAIHGRRQ